ncbi:MAG: ABC transporter permease [Dehalococcoidia bacterium]|jgi:ABC-type dipeptide/oligopeptide/nickel transport system permease component|nr:ABC transporter permease [Dehalococcoidia bacterium]MCH2313234.1 ABC transporter permease [SAR202 cluster bacterium]MEC7912896.1 ABC transporter permease [Chloroflexota bacterium]MBV46021.1 ABC transporter permease [Dehalococcoidia bacterium]MCS5649215.1 ABC transporter permease [Dehalococcoidia bacterium]|tara:strand:- start:6708 stop:7640 length:933 start_codon:yes stop_codon:yes gene_type:complete
MIRYSLGRLLGLVGSVLIISLILFIAVRWLPGTPWNEAEIPLQGAAKENMMRKYGLDQPVHIQYAKYLWNLIHLDLGNSFIFKTETVWETIARGWPATAKIGTFTLLIAFSIGIPVGIIAALRQNSLLDYTVTFLATTGITVPNFAVAVWLVMFISVKMDLLPTQGWGTWQHMVLPVVAYCLAPTSLIARFTRVSMLEAMRSDYIRTARAKGLAEPVVILRHVFKNALIPIITLVGPLIPNLMTGSIFIENTFGIPGIGRHFVTSIFDRDYPVIMGVFMMVAVLFGLTYFISDILYTWADPRVRLTDRQI